MPNVCEECARDFREFLRRAERDGRIIPEASIPPAPAPPSQLRQLFTPAPHDRAPEVAGRLATESVAFDQALGGGLPTGALVLLRTQEGAGGVEFALSVLRNAVRRRSAARAQFVTALRTPERARREALAWFEGEQALAGIDFRAPSSDGPLVSDLRAGDVAVVEEAASLSGGDANALDAAAREMGETAARAGGTVLLLESTGTLPPLAQARLDTHADAVFEFMWVGTPGQQRRKLTVKKLRGFAPVAESAMMPSFEVAFKRGVGFEATRITHLA